MRIRPLSLSLAAVAWAGAAYGGTVACEDAGLNIIDQDPAGLNVRASPGGPVIAAIKAKGRWVEVQVTGQNGGWARIDRAILQADENDNPDGTALWRGVGWVAFSKLGVSEFDSRARFHAAPDERSKVVLSLENFGSNTAPAEAVLGCDAGWLKVKVKGVVGWTNNWCANQLTTCV